MVTTVRIDFHIFININVYYLLHLLKNNRYFTVLLRDSIDLEKVLEELKKEDVSLEGKLMSILTMAQEDMVTFEQTLCGGSFSPQLALLCISDIGRGDVVKEFLIVKKRIKDKYQIIDTIITNNAQLLESGILIFRLLESRGFCVNPMKLGQGEQWTWHIVCDKPEELHLLVLYNTQLILNMPEVNTRVQVAVEIEITYEKELIARPRCLIEEDVIHLISQEEIDRQILDNIRILFDRNTYVQATCFNEFVKSGLRFTFGSQSDIEVCLSSGGNVMTINKQGIVKVAYEKLANTICEEWFQQISSTINVLLECRYPCLKYMDSTSSIDDIPNTLCEALCKAFCLCYNSGVSEHTKGYLCQALNHYCTENANNPAYPQSLDFIGLLKLSVSTNSKQGVQFYASFLVDIVGEAILKSIEPESDATKELIKILADAICVKTERIQSILSAKGVKSYKQEKLRDLAINHATKESLESIFLNPGKEERVEIYLQDDTKIATLHLKGTSVTNVELDPKHKEKIPDKLSIQVSEGVAVKIKDTEYCNSNINIKISDDCLKKLDKPLIRPQCICINNIEVLAIRDSDLLEELDNDDFNAFFIGIGLLWKSDDDDDHCYFSDSLYESYDDAKKKVKLKINIENKDGTRCDDVFVYNEDRRVYTTYGEIFNYPNILSASPQITCIGAGFLKISGMQGHGSEKRVIALTKSALSSLLSSSTNSTFELLFDLGVDNSTITLQIVYSQDEEKIQVSCSHTIVQGKWESILGRENMKNILIKTDTDLTTLSEVCRRAKRHDSEKDPSVLLAEVTNSVGIQEDNSIAFVS